MSQIPCGTSLTSGGAVSTSGCLVSFLDTPQMLLVMGVCHGLVGRASQQGDAVSSGMLPGQVFGRLRTWTTFRDTITADIGLVWVDPALVSASIVGLGPPKGVNTNPQVGDTLYLFSSPAGDAPRSGTISQLNQDVTLSISGPDWSLPGITYSGQILCQPMFNDDGDSGAVVLDNQNRVVGMVVGRQPLVAQNGGWVSQTVITPISAILNHPDLKGQLQVLSDIPAGLTAPSPAAAATNPPVVAAGAQGQVAAQPPSNPPQAAAPPAQGPKPTYESLVAGGFFSANPYDLSIPRSIRTNNPGALNWTTWQVARAGYVGKTQPDGSSNSNQTTIYRTPEHGVAAWYHLISVIYGFGKLPNFTLQALATHYAGDMASGAVNNYLNGWSHGSGGVFAPASSFSVSDSQAMLTLAKAMYFNEIGHPTPLGDDQILYAMNAEQTGTLPS